MEIKPASDGKIWAYYNVTSTSGTTKLLSSTNGLSKMEIDGVESSVKSSHLFDTLGECLVKFTPTTSNKIIYGNTFKDASALTKIFFPEHFRLEGQGILWSCSGLQYFNGENIEYLQQLNLRSCPLTNFEVNMPQLKYLGNGCFGYSGIKSVLNLGYITELGDAAFQSCKNLQTVILPPTVTKIGNQIFDQTFGVQEFTCLAITPPSLGSFRGAPSKIYVPAESVEAYKSAAGWSAYANKISAI